MSKKATEFQKKEMSKMYRGKEIFKPLNTGWIDENVACVREWVANIFFYRKGETTIMIDAGYNYDPLAEKMGWLGIDPASIRYILITHQDTDHVGAVEADSPGLFRNATLYVGETENRYLTGQVRRKVIYHLYKLPQVTINNKKVLLQDGQVLTSTASGSSASWCRAIPGATWCISLTTSTSSPATPSGSAQMVGIASFPPWRRTTSWRCGLWRRWRRSWKSGDCGHCSSPDTPAGRTTSPLPLLIRRSCALPSASASTTPTPPTTPMTSPTTPRLGPRAAI